MRKSGTKEDIKGSIGFQRTVHVNSSPLCAQPGGRRSDLMIRACTCTRRSSSLHNPNNTDILMTCKGCGGESTVDRGGPSCASKANTRGLELPRPIDLEVRWKTVNKRQRAARRARTSFSGEDRMKDALKSFYACPNTTSREVAQKDAPVSESEKLGVSILGRRFSDPLESVPIKKRRVLMDCSPSPPPTPLLADPYEKKLRISSGGISSYGKHRKVKTPGGKRMDEKRALLDIDDFSGISILAAAACESEMDVAMLNGECSKSAHSLEERKSEPISGSSELGLLHQIKGDKLNVPDASHCKLNRAKKLSETAPDMEPLLPTTLNSSESAPDMNPLLLTTLKSSENCVESAAALEANAPLLSLLSNANKTEEFLSVSDAKSSDVAISTNSSTDKPDGCFRDRVVHTKHSNAARDSRLHWDLNVAMEAWDIHSGGDDHDMVGPGPVASVSGCNDAEKEMNKVQACEDLSELKVAVDHHSGDEVHVVDVAKNIKTKGDGDFPGHSFQTLCTGSPQNMQLLESESLNGNNFSAETNGFLDLQKRSYVSEVELHLGSTNRDLRSSALTTEHFAFTANEEKLNASRTSPLDCEGSSLVASEDGHDGGSSIQTSDLGFRVKPMTSRIVSEESTNIATVTVSNKSCTDIGSPDDKLGQASLQSISEYKNQELFDVDSGTSKIDQSVNDGAEHASDVLCVAKRTADADTDSEHPENNPDTSNCILSYVHEEGGVGATINHKNPLITCANSSSAETYYISSGTHARGLNSECTRQAATDVDSILDSQSAAQSYPSGYKNALQKVASNNCLEHCYQTGTSHISKDLSVTGKVDVEEDDSQYEDGELRESGDRYWVNDGYDEVKCANHQVSNYKDEKAAPDIHLVPVGSVSNNMVTAVADYNGTHSRKEDCDVSPVSSKRSWSSNCLDGGSGIMYSTTTRSDHVSMRNETRLYGNSDRAIAGSAATVSQSERGTDGSGDDPLNISTKLIGWDTLPEDQQHSRHDSRDRVDSSNQCALGTLEVAEAGTSFQQMGLPNRDVQSRLGRPRSFDRPYRNEQCRSDDGYGSGLKAERTIDRSHGRGGASRHIQASSRGEQWMENSSNSRTTQQRSPDYYNYGPPGPRNAAEAAVAKMESNGFVVAPDGTLVRAVDAANAGTIARRVRNTSSSYHPLPGLGSPIDKDGSCGLSRAAHAREAPPERRFGASGNQSGRYDPEIDKDHATDGNLSSVRCPLSNRQRRFPPHRASLNLSRAHSRSPSGSRSRSPHTWTSPRNRREIMANGGSSIRRHSRSPNYMTEVRIGRMTSPRRQPGFSDRVMRDSSSSRNHTYAQHDSTWVDGRSCSTVNIADHKKRCSRRSPPPRITSRDDRFDVMDSQGQPRSREFHRATEVPYGFEKGNKHGRNGDDKREYNDRYGTVKPYERNGTMKQFRNHTGDKLHPRISAPRSPEPQRRGSPRRF